MIRVGIVGATGYTAQELIKILLRHPEVEITQLTSRDESCPSLADVHHEFRQRLEINFSVFDVDDFAAKVDCAFCCLPHAASAEIVSKLLSKNVKVVDFSADYRLNDVETFEKWYQVKHPDASRIGKVPYGLPELFRDEIKTAQLVANPGCFPTSALLPLAPLTQQGLIDPSSVIVDSKTGVSGAGRKPNLKFHYPECNESVMAYSVGTHRHMPEINQIIQRHSGTEIATIFTPHLIPMDRGILSTIYCQSASNDSPEEASREMFNVLAKFYADEPFVRVSETIPTTKDVARTNFCDIAIRQVGNKTVIVSALDNLIKGASGAAVQNFNLMFGLPETTALL